MAERRTFYVTQDALVVWHCFRNDVQREICFQSGDDGFRQFDAYLAKTSQRASLMLVDVIEEEFAADTIPKLSYRDRKALIQRRLRRKFPRTPYRLGIYQGRRDKGADEFDVTHSAISNDELLDPWLEIIVRHSVPLSGIYSVPHLTADLLSKLHSSTGNALLMTQHQGQKLRQVFLRSGKVRSARLSQSPEVTDTSYGEYLFDEIMRSRRYLERTRLLSNEEELDVYVVVGDEDAAGILNNTDRSKPLRIHFIDPEKVAAKIAGVDSVRPDQQESLYIALCNRRPPRYNYAQRGETRYSTMLRVRHVLMAASVLLALTLSVVSGYMLADTWSMRKRVQTIDGQIEQMSETFRREHASFQPIRADSHEMKTAVDTGDFILKNRLPVPWVMQQLGLVLGDFPEMQLGELQWAAETPPDESGINQRRGDAPRPVQIRNISAVTAEFSGRIEPHDGNLRVAFARIDSLVEELEARTAFDSVVAIEYPVDARPQSSLNGEIAPKDQAPEAVFRVRLTLNLAAPENADEQA